MEVQQLPESAALTQAWLNRHLGSAAPVIRVRPDLSLFVETGGARFVACAASGIDGSNGQDTHCCLWCLSSTGERHYFQSLTIECLPWVADEEAILVCRKPAGTAKWSYERWRDGVREVTTDDREFAIRGPADDAPEVDPVLLRWLWPHADVYEEAVARRMGVPRHVVRQRAFALGLPSPSDARQAGGRRLVLAELWGDTSMSKAEICRRLGLSREKLARYARQLELPARPKPDPRSRRRAASRAGSPARVRIAAALQAANEPRTQAAAEAMLERTRAALYLPETDVPRHLREAGELRIAHPEASLAALAQLAGCGKDTLAGRLRRLWQRAEQVQAV